MSKSKKTDRDKSFISLRFLYELNYVEFLKGFDIWKQRVCEEFLSALEN